MDKINTFWENQFLPTKYVRKKVPLLAIVLVVVILSTFLVALFSQPQNMSPNKRFQSIDVLAKYSLSMNLSVLKRDIITGNENVNGTKIFYCPAVGPNPSKNTILSFINETQVGSAISYCALGALNVYNKSKLLSRYDVNLNITHLNKNLAEISKINVINPIELKVRTNVTVNVTNFTRTYDNIVQYYSAKNNSTTNSSSNVSIINGPSTQYNWAGYVVPAAIPYAPTIHVVLGSWIVQSALASSQPTYSSQWVGIGGWYESDSLIQTGTTSYYTGEPMYSAWYELIGIDPYAVPINAIVEPGDIMWSIIYLIPNTTNQWNITIADKSEDWQASNIFTYSSSQDSAEWIDERPMVDIDNTLVLSNLTYFSTSYYGDDYTNTANTETYCSSIVGCQVLGEYSPAAITMINYTNYPLAEPSSVSSDGTSFNVTRNVPPLTVANPTPSTQEIYLNQLDQSSNIVSSGASGGIPSYTYQWTATAANGNTFTTGQANALCSDAQAENCLFTVTPVTETGAYQFKITATDYESNTATSNAATVIVTTPLTLSVTPSTNTIKIGNSANFASSVSGGIPPYHYSWTTNAPFLACINTANPANPANSSMTNSVANCTFGTYSAASGYGALPNEGTTLLPGTYNLSLTVTDNGIGRLTSSSSVTVTEASNVIKSPSLYYSGPISPAGYYNITLVNNANTPTNSSAPVLIVIGCSGDDVTELELGNGCAFSGHGSPPFLTPLEYRGVIGTTGSNAIFFYDNGSIIPSWFDRMATSGNIYYYLRLNKSIQPNQGITIHMGLAKNSSVDYTGICSAGFVLPSLANTLFNVTCLNNPTVGEAPWQSVVYGGHDNGFNIFQQYDNFGAFPLASSASVAGNWQQANITSWNPTLTSANIIFNGIIVSTKTFNNLNTIIMSSSSSTQYGYGKLTPNGGTPTGAVGTVYFTNPYSWYSETIPNLAANGNYDFTYGAWCPNIDEVLPCGYGPASGSADGPSYLGGYNSTVQQYGVDEGIQDIPGFGSNADYWYTASMMSSPIDSSYIGSYPIEFNFGSGGQSKGFIAVMAKSAQTPSVNFAPAAHSLTNSHPFGPIIRIFGEEPSIRLNINVYNGSYYGGEPYNLSFDIITKAGSCATSTTYDCVVYEGSGVITQDGTPQTITVTANQIAAYSGNALSVGNYTLFATVQKGLVAIAQSYVNLTITNPIVPISLTNNQNSATGPDFQQMITFNSVAYQSYEANDLGNIRFYQGSNELYSWCESGCSSSSTNSIFWILLPNGMPANSRVIINATFFSTGTEYDGVYAGEALQLSASYGQYDNGALVFPLYQNFAGGSYPTCSGGWTCSVPFYKGLSMTAGSGTSELDTNNSYFSHYSAPVIEDTYANLGVTNNALSNVAAMSFTEQAYNSVKSTFYLGYRNNVAGLAGISFPTQPSLGFHVWTFVPGGIVSASYDYNSNTAVYDQINLNPLSQTLLGYNATNNASITAYWTRLRINPPNGVMPSVAFGNGIVSFPSNILYAIPIALTNKQSAAVAANTAISVPFNALAYKAYETSTLNNTEFFYANGTIIPSWMEGNTLNEVAAANTLYKSANVLFWLRIYSSNVLFPANSANTIYIGFAGNVPSVSNMLLTNALTGEAPQLSCNNPSNTIGGCTAGQYAEYDNGASVFGVYDDFTGKSLNPMWTLYNYNPSNTALTVENSVDIRGKVSGGTQNAGMYAPYTSNAATNVAGIIYESLADAVMPASAWRMGLGYGTTSSSPSMEYGFMSILAGATNTLTIIASHSGGGQTNLQTPSDRLNPGSWYVDQFRWSAAHTENAVNLVSGVSANAASSAYSVNQISEIVPIETGQNLGNEYRVQWTRVRTYPPNGIMPSSTFGNVI